MTAPHAAPTLLTALPNRSIYRPEDRILIDVGVHRSVTVQVSHLGTAVRTARATGPVVDIGTLPAGGYGIDVTDPDERHQHTAVDVTLDPRTVLRYGFVVDYSPGRTTFEVEQLLRRLHLTAVQFYDWAYRHADLLGPDTGDYSDALGQPISPEAVRALIAAVHRVGADALGYAAVYGVGNDEWPAWAHDALLTATGTPHALADFLQLVDPAAPDWLHHFCADLNGAAERFGFDGFHLDQYGYPKRATRADGQPIDLARSFDRTIAAVRNELPAARLVFNNVNDFPTWRTTSSPQDATYIEIWPPHTHLADLAGVITRARALAPERPVVIAAYQHIYATANPAAADLCTALTMATLFSHGATQLLAGEDGRLLVDPYYVHNQRAEAESLIFLTRWYDFLVEYGELLLDASAVDVTGSYAGDYNGDLDVSYPGATIDHRPTSGSVWRRIVQVRGRLVVHLINLTGQTDTEWDSLRQTPGHPGPGALRFRLNGPGIPRIRFADPDGPTGLTPLPVTVDGDHAVVTLPTPRIWQVVVLDTDTADTDDDTTDADDQEDH